MATATGPLTTNLSPRITLLEGEQARLADILSALQGKGMEPYEVSPDTDPLVWLYQTDLLVMDINTARLPKTSRFTRVPHIVVLTPNSDDTLPPWLQTRHIRLESYPNNAEQWVASLSGLFPARQPEFRVDSYPTEQLELLFGITQFLSVHLDLDDLLERILALCSHLNAQYSSVLLQETGNGLYYRSTFPGHEELTGASGIRLGQRLLDNGLEGWVMRHQKAVVIKNTQADIRWYKYSYLPDQPCAVAALPIQLERVAASGFFMLGHSRRGHFSEAELPLLTAVVTQISSALENALLFRNQAQRSVQLALINEATQAATSILNLEVMLRTVVQAIQRSFALHSVGVYLYHADNNQLELKAQAVSNRQGNIMAVSLTPDTTVATDHGLLGWAFSRRKTALANDVLRDSRLEVPEPTEIRAELCVPIIIGAKILGVLDLQNTQFESFSAYHVNALETLADQLAIAIENARLYDAFNQRVQELKTLNQIGQAVTSTLNLQETLTLITDQTISLMKVAAASVALIDEEANDVWFAAASGEGATAVIGVRIARGQGIAGWVAESGEAVIVPDVYTDDRFFPDIDRSSGFTTQSLMCVPLQTKGHVIGAIEVMNKENTPFNQDDLALLQAMATPAATAIENARLYEEKTETIKRLAQTQNQLIQSAKLAAVGELAAGVAHEINNPLTTIMGLSSLLLDSSSHNCLDDETREDLGIMQTEAQRARNIVRSLLNFARTDTPNRQPTDFNQLVEEAIFLVFTKGVSSWVTLKKRLTPLPEVNLDPNQTKQVLVNLLNNAIQAMQEGQKPAVLTIITHLQTQRENSAIVLSVSDTGQGIDPIYLDKIFDPFFTTKEVGQGTGLGLSISYGIVERHSGTIQVESTPNQGSTFVVTLPVK
jgi:signal transduction histidine kinase